MRHFIYYTNLVLFAILFPLLPSLSAHAQSEEKVRCSMAFTAKKLDYKSNTLRITWLVDEAPRGYDIVALQITQNSEVVPEVGSGDDWRRYRMNDGEAHMDVTNLHAGEFILDAMLLDGGGSPCKDSDKGIWLATTKEDKLIWKPPTVTYEVKNFLTEHDKNLVSFYINVKEPLHNVNYIAWIEQGGTNIGTTEMKAINNYPERVEIPIASINLKKVAQEIPIKIYVDAWYTDHHGTSIITEKEAMIPPTPKLGFLSKIGKVVMTVLNSQAAIAGIILVLGGLLIVKIYSKDDKPTPKIEYGRPPKNAIVKQQILTPSQVSIKPLNFSVRIRQATASRHENVIAVDEFPCVFGRNKHLENGQTEKNKGKLFTNILHDAKISREHFEIRKRDNVFYIASRSENGTKVNQNIVAKGEQVPLSLFNSTIVEIGEQTKIELQSV